MNETMNDRVSTTADTVEALLAAFALLRDDQSVLGSRVREELVHSTGLSRPMIEWGLRTSLPERGETLRSAVQRALTGVAQQITAEPLRVSVILSGNVFTACIRALAWPLLLGTRVTAKAASHDDVLPRAFSSALREVDATVAARLEVLRFDRTNTAAMRGLLGACDVVSVYGSDATIEAVQAAVDPDVSVIAHGHGVGALYVTRSALANEHARQTWAERAALDVAAYDQRGCLSPHVIYVDAVDTHAVNAFVQALTTALRALETQLPRGPLTEEAAIAQAQWRGSMAACATLLEGPSFGIALLQQAQSHGGVDIHGAGSVVTGPGYRNVSVVAIEDLDVDVLWAQLQPLGVHLKALGVAGDPGSIALAQMTLPTTLRPLLSEAGQMQTPAFDADADGESPWFGLT